ncbi:MAG: hypothetical protein JO322_10595 [Candidatus Eremiobacteraeota bacterium]|nr:hypothetical protein [Candidatus Eremiobacteraeota bacterium]
MSSIAAGCAVNHAVCITIWNLERAMPGFVEGTLLVNEETSEILSVTTWSSRHNWAFFFPLAKATKA